MTKTMRRIGNLLIACLLIASLLGGASASAAGLLQAMLDIALRADRAIEATFHIEGGDLLTILSAISEGDEQTLTAVRDLLDNGLVRARYARDGEQDVLSLALEVHGEALLTLDARLLDGETAIETSLLPGKTLIAPVELSPDIATLRDLGEANDAWADVLNDSAAQYVAVLDAWLARSEGVIRASDEPLPATQTRDAATGSITLRVSDAQAMDLLTALINTFVRDTALLTVLSAQTNMTPVDLSSMALQIPVMLGVPQGHAAEITVYHGERDALVGIDARFVPAAGAADAASGSLAYGHRTLDAAHDSDSIHADIRLDEDASLQAQFYRRDKIPNPIMPREGAEYGGRARFSTPDTGALELEVWGDIARTVEPVLESTEHTVDFRLSQGIDQADASDLQQMIQAPLFEAGITQSSKTEVVGIEDFRYAGSFALRLLGHTATVYTTLESGEYTPAEHPDYSVIRLDEMTEDELAALNQELEQNAMGLLTTLMPGLLDPVSNVEPAVPGDYVVDDEHVPSIDLIVGSREIIDTLAGITEGKPYVQTFYQVENGYGDVETYANSLLGVGWALTRLEGEISNGLLQLANESAHDGNLLLVTIEFTTDSYSVLVHRTPATLRRYADEYGNQLGEITLSGDAPMQPGAEADPDVLARGRAALDSGAQEEALRIYDAALAEQPGVAAYLGGRGEALVALGRYSEAVVPLTTAIEADPDNWLHLNERGVAYFYLDQMESALSDFERSVARKPDHPDGYFNLAYVQTMQGQAENALLTCAMGLTVFPDSDDLWVVLGDARHATGDATGALDAYDRAISYGNYTPEYIPAYAEVQGMTGG